MGYEEQLRQSAGTGEVPRQRSAGRIERPTDDRGGGQLTARLVLLALMIILLGSAGGLAGALVLPKTYG
ncbi:MAG TPA: hypothetical protein VGO16_02540, partial [Pseudonocardiaceae bacterium]|nr:hypothetical protein [Pseudonocardiaceae bacterium]